MLTLLTRRAAPPLASGAVRRDESQAPSATGLGADDPDGAYDVVVTGDCGSDASAAATLTVLEDVSITADPSGAAVCEGARASP